MKRHPCALLLGLLLPAALSAQVIADEESVNAAIEGSLTLAGGGTLLDGNRAAYERRFQHAKDGFGGIEELVYRRETRTSSLAIDGHALPGDENYGFLARWTQNEKVYAEFGYDQYRVFYDGSGGYFPGAGSFFPIYADRMHLDRSRLWLELGFDFEDLPRLALRYERLTRRGEKPSTMLGETNLTNGFGGRTVVPAFYELDEARDIFSLRAERDADDLKWSAAARYEHTELDNARQQRRRPNEAAASRAVTSNERTDTDLFSTHAFVERRFSEQLLASAGALFTTLDTHVAGDRIFGADYDPVFDPAFARRQIGDVGFLNLDGGGRLRQYVFNLNTVYAPSKKWTIRPALRFENLQQDTLSTFVATNVIPGLTTLQNAAAQSEKQENRLTETIEIRYTGRPNWTYSLRGEWFQTQGDLSELQVDRTTIATLLAREVDYTRDSQKYTLAATWYARPGLSFSSEYYYKLRFNDYEAKRDTTSGAVSSPDRYPSFITNQDFSTHDFNVRASWRPASGLSLVTRYDFQISAITSSFVEIPELRSSRTTSHIVSQSVMWSPVPRLYLVSSGNLTFDQLSTPAAALVANSDNNYLNASVGGGYVLSKTTDLFLDFSHYRARNFTDNSALSQPYGADQKMQTASLTCVVRQTEHLAYTVRYTHASNLDRTSGGKNDYRAHTVYGNIQYKF
jgi:hypothetical protein